MMQLSALHKAMLKEMGVSLWLPEGRVTSNATADAAAHAGIVLPVRDLVKPLVQNPQTRVIQTQPYPTQTADSQPSPHARTEAQASPTQKSNAARGAMPTRVISADDFVAQAFPLNMETANWADLQAQANQCRACRLCLQRKQTVFGVGTQAEPPPLGQTIDWLVVGETLGEQEDLQGEPFLGAAGKLLDQMLLTMQLSRVRKDDASPSLYITTAVKCSPPGNRNPLPDEIQTCSAYLQGQIRLLRPRMILALGRFAAQAVLKDSVPGVDAMAVGQLRGRVHRCGDIPVVVSNAPSYLLRHPAAKAKSWADLCLAMQTLEA